MRWLVLAALGAVIAGCAPGGGSGQSSTPSNVHTEKSIDGSFDGEVVGTPAPGSRFAKVRIGMRERQVEDLIGRPDDTDSHITGKQFIPFFFGGDTHRLEAFYRGEGIVTYSPQHLGGEANTVIRIIADPTEQGVAH